MPWRRPRRPLPASLEIHSSQRRCGASRPETCYCRQLRERSRPNFGLSHGSPARASHGRRRPRSSDAISRHVQRGMRLADCLMGHGRAEFSPGSSQAAPNVHRQAHRDESDQTHAALCFPLQRLQQGIRDPGTQLRRAVPAPPATARICSSRWPRSASISNIPPLPRPGGAAPASRAICPMSTRKSSRENLKGKS